MYHLEIPMKNMVVTLERVREVTVVVGSFDFERLQEKVKVTHYLSYYYYLNKINEY
jgi:hypothetical protein